MGKILLPFLFIYIFSQTANANNGWNYINPKPAGSNYFTVKFLDQNTIIVAGGGGITLKTTNRGNTWIVVQNDFNGTSLSISFKDQNTGVISTYSNRVLKTTNAGDQWSMIIDSTYNTIYSIRNDNIHFFSDDRIYMSASQEDTKLRISSNAGLNWMTNDTIFSHRMKFVDDNVGYAGIIFHFQGPSRLYKTTNSGQTWNILNYNHYLQNLFFYNSDIGIIYHNFEFWSKTTNGGNSWQDFTVPSAPHTTMAAKITDPQTIYTASRDSIWKSTNFGTSFQRSFGINTNLDDEIYAMDFWNNEIGAAVGNNGAIYLTTNGGVNWDSKKNGFYDNIRDLSIADNYSYIVGLNNRIFKINNSNFSIDSISIPGGEKMFGIYFHDQNNGYIAGESGKILKTSNNGISWIELHSNINYYLVDIEFANEDYGYSVGSSGKILKTSNGGVNWSAIEKDSMPTGQFFNLQVINENKLYVAGEGGMFRTTNGGNNWQNISKRNLSGFIAYSDIHFINDQTGFASGLNYSQSYSQFIMKTTDSGNNWDYSLLPNDLPLSIHFNSICFISDSIGYCSGQYGTILKTTNAGHSWNIDFSCKNFEYISRDVNFRKIMYDEKSKQLFAAGDDGLIIQKKLNTVGIYNHENNSNTPTSFSLSQNYPNPFNPSTNISFEIPSKQKISLIIYNILGKSVAVLVNDVLSAGKHNYAFDASNLPSGVYFYKLTAGNEFTQTKKMLLIK